MRIAMTSKEKKEDVDRQESFSNSCGKKAAKVGKTREVRGHEKRHQEKVVRSREM